MTSFSDQCHHRPHSDLLLGVLERPSVVEMKKTGSWTRRGFVRVVDRSWSSTLAHSVWSGLAGTHGPQPFTHCLTPASSSCRVTTSQHRLERVTCLRYSFQLSPSEEAMYRSPLPKLTHSRLSPLCEPALRACVARSAICGRVQVAHADPSPFCEFGHCH